MPLSPHIIQTWLFNAFVAAVLVRWFASTTRERPRLYLVLWCCGVLIFGIAAVWSVYWIANVPLYSQRRGGGDPGAIFPTPGELVWMFLGLLTYVFRLPGLFALGLSPPNYRVSRRAWIVGAITLVSSIAMAVTLIALDRRYMNDFHATKARNDAASTALWKWRNVTPPDPVVGPTRFGEWSYLGGTGQYTVDPGGDLIRLSFSSPGRGLPPFRREALKWLAKEKSLQSLDFHGLLTDDDIVYLKPLTWLNRLELVNTAITDKGVAELKSLTSLEHLELQGAPVTSASLEVLVQFPSLRDVGLSLTQISHEELRQFCLANSNWEMSGLTFGMVRKRK